MESEGIDQKTPDAQVLQFHSREVMRGCLIVANSRPVVPTSAKENHWHAVAESIMNFGAVHRSCRGDTA